MSLCIKELYLSAGVNPDDRKNDPKKEHTDVIAVIALCEAEEPERTRKYIASFFSYESIPELRRRHQQTGEFLNGKYFFTGNMLLIDECSPESIRAVVEHLIEEGEFKAVFHPL